MFDNEYPYFFVHVIQLTCVARLSLEFQPHNGYCVHTVVVTLLVDQCCICWTRTDVYSCESKPVESLSYLFLDNCLFCQLRYDNRTIDRRNPFAARERHCTRRGCGDSVEYMDAVLPVWNQLRVILFLLQTISNTCNRTPTTTSPHLK